MVCYPECPVCGRQLQVHTENGALTVRIKKHYMLPKAEYCEGVGQVVPVLSRARGMSYRLRMLHKRRNDSSPAPKTSDVR